MLFSSSVFLFIFLPVVLGVYFNPWIKSRVFRNIWLLIASLTFYAWGEPVFVFLMVSSIFINWLISLAMEKMVRYKKKWLILSVGINIGILFVFKYLTFVMTNIRAVSKGNWVIPQIVLPVGISFFTFQIISYMFDVYYGKVAAQHSCYKFALYVAMFPQLVAGPIVRYSQIADEIDHRTECRSDINEGLVRFCWGLGKKVIFSNYLGILADNVFYLSKNGEISVALAWIGSIAYTLQIYYDFSGYSDMAIGLGRIFGFHFQENFNYPYVSKSITEFWRRWHISLSSWFRDYVYIPLGGSRASARRVVYNTFVVWLLTGIWHGANWTFLLWGLGYFGLLMLERRLKLKDGMKHGGQLYTLFWVNLLWVVFRSDSLPLAFKFIAQMFGRGKMLWDFDAAKALGGSWVILVLAMVFALPVGQKLAETLNVKDSTRRNVKAVLALPIFILCLAKCVVSNYNPFIYFNF